MIRARCSPRSVLGAAGAVLLALATLTTNFVNIYMSALAWKTLLPRTGDAAVVWSIGIVGAVLSAVPALWLQQYANFMMVLGATLVPVGGVLIAHYYLASDAARHRRRSARGVVRFVGPVPGRVDSRGGGVGSGSSRVLSGRPIGGTLPALASSIVVYLGLRRMIS
jgi:hypothetical protein